MDMDNITEITRAKQYAQFEALKLMKVKDKRSLFLTLRSALDVTVDTFFPKYGITAGEFAVWQILAEYSRRV